MLDKDDLLNVHWMSFVYLLLFLCVAHIETLIILIECGCRWLIASVLLENHCLNSGSMKNTMMAARRDPLSLLSVLGVCSQSIALVAGFSFNMDFIARGHGYHG